MNSPFAPISPTGLNTGLSAVNMKAFASHDKEAKDDSFSNVFLGFLNNVNESQMKAAEYTKALVSGKLENTHEMAIAGAKSEVMLHLATQIASKLSAATTQLFQMQI